MPTSRARGLRSPSHRLSPPRRGKRGIELGLLAHRAGRHGPEGCSEGTACVRQRCKLTGGYGWVAHDGRADAARQLQVEVQLRL
jgi:hypothetical protein